MPLARWQWYMNPVKLYFSHLVKICKIYPYIQPHSATVYRFPSTVEIKKKLHRKISCYIIEYHCY